MVISKYNTKDIFLFIGYIENRKEFYNYLKNCGFALIFKEAILHECTVPLSLHTNLANLIVSFGGQNCKLVR